MIKMKIQITKALEHSNYVRENPGKMSSMPTQQIHSRFKALTEEEIPDEERKKRDNMCISLNDQIREPRKWRVLKEEDIPEDIRVCRDRDNKI